MFGIVCTPYARTSDGLPAKAPRAGKLRKGHKTDAKAKNTDAKAKNSNSKPADAKTKNINPADQRIEKRHEFGNIDPVKAEKQTGLKDALVPDMSE